MAILIAGSTAEPGGVMVTDGMAIPLASQGFESLRRYESAVSEGMLTANFIGSDTALLQFHAHRKASHDRTVCH